MISFKQYITEARMAPLYHGTDLKSAAQILESDTLKLGDWSTKTHWPSKDGTIISLTRNLTFALKWEIDGIVFEFDQQKLSQRYKIVPFNFFASKTRRIPDTTFLRNKDYNFDNQFEESLVQPVKNVSKYITKIIVTNQSITELDRSVKFRPELYGPLRNHPLLYNIDTKEFVNK